MTHEAADGRIAIRWLPSAEAGPDVVAGVVAQFAGIAPEGVRIVHACRSCGSDRHGKPHVVVPAGHRALHVSLSRSGGLTVVAVTDAGPIGVDVEAVGPGAPFDLVDWVRRESVVKATGHGITADPAGIDAVLNRAGARTSDLAAPAGYVAAVTTLAAPAA